MVLLPWHRPTNIGMGRHLSVTCMSLLLIYTSSVVLGSVNLTSYPATAREGELFTMICSKPGVFPQLEERQWYRSAVHLFTTCLGDKSIRESNILVFNYSIAGRINVICDSNTHNVTLRINSTVDNGSVWQCLSPRPTQISNNLTIEVYSKDNTINNITRSTVTTTPMSATIATTAAIMDTASASTVTSTESSLRLTYNTSPSATSDTSSPEYSDPPGKTVTSKASSSRLPGVSTSPSTTSDTSSSEYTDTPVEVSITKAPIPTDTNPTNSVSANLTARASSSTSPTSTSTSSSSRPSSSTTATTTLTTVSSTKITTEDAFLQDKLDDQTASVGFIVAGVGGGLVVMAGVILAVVCVTRKRAKRNKTTETKSVMAVNSSFVYHSANEDDVMQVNDLYASSQEFRPAGENPGFDPGVKKTVIDSTDIYSTMSRDTDTHHYTDLNRMRSVSTRDSGMTSSLSENTDITSDVHVYYNTVTASGEGINHENPRLASSFI